MNQGYVKTSIQEAIAHIEFFHPSSNSMPGALLNQLALEIELAGLHADVRVIVLKSAGDKAFCAGASFDELMAIENLEVGKAFFSGFAKVINAIRKTPVFVLGRVQGKAVGGGVGIASAVDYCYATTQAQVKLSELAVGIGPFVVGPAVERKIGLSAFSELSINASQWRDALWAKQKGLFMEVYETTADMDYALETLAKQLSNSSPEAMKALKQVIWQGTEHWDTLLFERALISGNLVLSEYTKQFISTFKNKS